MNKNFCRSKKMDKEDAKQQHDGLRRKAEEQLQQTMTSLNEKSHEDVQTLLHEFQVHQIELEMQNQELLRTQAELETSRKSYIDLYEKYVHLYDFAPVGYCTVEKDGAIQEINLTAAEQLGLERTSLLNTRLYSCIVQEDRETFFLHLRNAFETQTRQTCEVTLLKQDGSSFYAQLESIVVQENAEVLTTSRCRTTITDISTRKRIEEKLRHAKEAALEAQRAAETASQVKSVFLANINHELRTPLNGILGYAQLLTRDPQLTGSQRSGIEIIERSGQHLLELINTILDLAKIEANKMELHETEISLPDFLVEISEIIRVQAQQRGIAFRYETTSELPHLVRADEKQLCEILLNLLSNAIKFTERGGVTLKAGHLPPTVFKEKGVIPLKNQHSSSPKKFFPQEGQQRMIRFQVSDSGIGIAQEHLEEIFAPFTQIYDQTRTTQGTGLGLALSRQIVRLMDSELYVRSTVGQGSTFWFDVAFHEVPGSGKKNVTSSYHIVGIRGQTATILIVDDHEENRWILRDFLSPLGFDIVEAVNGRDALEKAVTYHPELVLMDLVMPEMGGSEATRHIRQLPDLKETIVIAVSASATALSEQKYTTDGCDDALIKPIKFDSLLEKLQKYLHLEWIYRDGSARGQMSDSTQTTESLIPPSEEELKTLSRLVVKGDIKAIRQWAQDTERFEPACSPFLARIASLAQTMQISRLQNFVEQYIKD